MNPRLPEDQRKDCIKCGCKTLVPIDAPLDQQVGNIHGVGQLCENCMKKYVMRSFKSKNLSHEDKIKFLEEQWKKKERQWGNRK